MAGKKIKGRKRAVVCDTQGNLVYAHSHPADMDDREGLHELWKGLREAAPAFTLLHADGQYTGAEVANWLATQGVRLEIAEPPADRTGFVVVPVRWVVERAIAWLNRCRRLAKDYEKLEETTDSFCYLASIQRLLNRLHPSPNRTIRYQYSLRNQAAANASP
jgi:transposase